MTKEYTKFPGAQTSFNKKNILSTWNLTIWLVGREPQSEKTDRYLCPKLAFIEKLCI